MTIDPSMMRLLWAVVADIESHDLLLLSDTALVKLLLQQVSRRMLLSGEEIGMMYEYTSSRIPLIRDMADRSRSRGIDFAMG